jgi:outer membrane beta-barrel protein
MKEKRFLMKTHMNLSKLMSLPLACMILATLTLVPATASAQEDAVDPLEEDFDMYWANNRDVTNIHKRLFLKDGRHEFTIFGGVIPNDDFFTYYPVGLRYDFYFSEDFAIEVSGAYFIKQDSDLASFLQNDIAQGSLEVDLPQFLEWQAGAGVLWTPIHGKVGAFGTRLGHFDFGIALGVMVLGTQHRLEGEADYKSRPDVGGNVGATARVYLTDFLALRVDYRHYFYAARDAQDNSRGVSFPAEISLGVSFFTSAPK